MSDLLIRGAEMPNKNKTCYGYKQDYVDFRIWDDGTVELLCGAYANRTPYKAVAIHHPVSEEYKR